MELALPIENRMIPFTRWTSRTVSLGAVPSIVRVGAYTAFLLMGTVHLLMPILIAVIA
jgi:hypothetical protein